ncbi:Protein of unknown function DUF604 [Macleaya cordata]|uniref:Fringe-like n=1 Tax=Macleaya cordata TaxID=56857 RepID=A0A200R548_MACCD|nr:Protein of unknown function DUF604 [Macleaya cordata]
MSQIRETSHDPFKACKFLIPPTEKNGDFFTLLMKWVLSITLLASIALFFFSAFSSQCRCLMYPDCNRIVQNPQITFSQNTGEYHEKTNISHILFGIGGSAKTWKNRRHYSELWWKPNITRGFVWLDKKPDLNEPWPEGSPPYRVSENTSSLKYTNLSGSRSAVRIARIVLESYRLGLRNVRWFVMGDDDTVFFTDNLVTVLSKYDHNQMYYIGGNSESVEQDMLHSYGMAYGGGGFAISYPLAAALSQLLDGCIVRYSDLYGSDERIFACLAEIGVPLTRELGFHQIDIRGDPYGLLAAHPVAPLVSLHHLDYVKPLFPNRTQLDSLKLLVGAYRTDPGRTLQQSLCYDLNRYWSISVAWGYTVQIYPSLVMAKDLWTPMQTFNTWRSWSNNPFTFNTRPVKPGPHEHLVTYFLDEVVEVGEGTFTTYTRLLGETATKCDQPEYVPELAVKKINVSASKMEAYEWEKGPRRQCCEIINGSDEKEDVLHISIRRCHHGESVTPHYR